MRRGLPALGLALAAGLALACAPHAALPIWEQPPPPASDAPVVDAAKLHRHVLPNGIEVLVLEDHRLPRFDLGLALPRGAGIESRDEAGLAGFTAELMERGAGDRDALALAAEVDDLGARLTVSADWDATTIAVGGLSRDLPTLLQVLEDVALRPRFDAAEAAKVRAELLARLRQSADDPKVIVGWRLVERLYPEHRYGLPRDGRLESVAKLDAAAARGFHARVLRPEGAILYAVGDVDPDAFLAEAQARFGGLAGAGPVPAVASPTPPAERHIVVVDRPELVQAQIALGHGGVSRTAPDRVAIQLMNGILGGGGFTSRLMARIRSDEGLTYSIASYFDERRAAGPFVIATFTRVAEVGRLLQGVLEEVERVRAEPPPAAEVAEVQSQRVGSFALALETSTAVLGALVDIEIHDLPADSLDTYRARIRAVTPDQVAAAARDHLHPELLSIVVVGPADQIAPQLAPFGKVEIVRP